MCYSQSDIELLKQGEKLFHEQNYTEALKIFREEMEKNPSCEARFWVAGCYYHLEDFSTAKRWFLEIIEDTCSGPERAFSLCDLGNCYCIAKQWDSAEYYFDKCIYEYPEYSEGYNCKAQMLYETERFEEAKDAYTYAILLDPSDWFKYSKHMEVSFILKEYEAALFDIVTAKKLNPDLDIAFNLAFCYSMLEEYQNADSIYRTIYDENDALFLNNYGFNKHKLGQSDEGIALIQKSLAIDPENSYAYRNLAIIDIDKGRFSEACKHLQRAKNLNFYTNYGKEVNDLIDNYCH